MRRRRELRFVVLVAVAVTIVAWQFPLGRLVLWPFTLLATFAHEMGHGLTAMLLGADFETILMRADGSGVATWSGSLGRFGRAMVAAGGLIGPAFLGAGLLVASSREKAGRPLIALLLLFSLFAFFRVGSVFTAAFLATLAVTAAALLKFGSVGANVLAVRLMGVQLGLSVFQDLSYMFSPGQGGQVSDSMSISQALFLPYWVWGGLVALVSFSVLALGLWTALREPV
ncbi:MAG: M50 family metallopeptidase [Deltaproteobacteria bacterium]|nr:M50 family metallopeptidase [Deltaproteobacteria bacterium]